MYGCSFIQDKILSSGYCHLAENIKITQISLVVKTLNDSKLDND